MAKMRIRKGIIYVDFRYQCKRYVLSTGLPDTKQNKQTVNLKLKAIEYDISINKLNLARYGFKDDKKEKREFTLSEYFNERYVKEKNIRQGTWEILNWTWNTHIFPRFGHYKLSEISSHEILVFRNYLLNEKKLAGSSINTIIKHLSIIINNAIDARLLSETPLKKIGKLPEETNSVDPFSFDELHHFLDFLKDKKPYYYDMIYIWSRCGFRHGEILALKWDDLDYYNRQLNINRTLHINGVEGLPKTLASKRSISLRPAVIEAFKRQEKRSRMASDYIFLNEITQKRYNGINVFTHVFRHLLKLAGLKYRSPNQLRHTFATLHIAAGENISWVSKIMGHTDTVMTQKRYNKYIPNLTRDDGSAFENIFENSQFGYKVVTRTIK